MRTTFAPVFASAVALALAAAPVAVQAHPHVFIDTQLRVDVAPDGTLRGIEVSWTYDDFYSLLIFADMGLDQDGDARLSPNEVARLDGFDLQWIDGYEGDSYVTRSGQPVPLGAPEPRGTRVEDGRITTVHYRPAQGPADGAVIKAYDPYFYTAYTLITPVKIDGPCAVDVTPVNLDKAYSLAEEMLYGGNYDQDAGEYPEVGEAFADTVVLTCAG